MFKNICLVYCSLIFICGFSGVTYRGYTHDVTTKVHVLILDPQQVTLNTMRAQDMGRSLATVSEIGQHFSAIAAINGGFFRLNLPTSGAGLAAGILKIKNHWHGISYKPRGAVAWDPATNRALFDIVQTDSSLKIADLSLPINAFNKVVDGNRASLLSDSYIDHIRLQDNIGFLIQDNHITEIYKHGSILIPPGSYVYNVAGVLRDQVRTLMPGNTVQLEIMTTPLLDRTSANEWANMPNIIGGGPLLIKNGVIIRDYGREQLSPDFVEQRHARSALGIRANGEWMLIMVEKSLLAEDSGMTLEELAKFMGDQGCTDALNLDGGGSSSMYVNMNLVSRWNSLLPERPVANALLVLAKPQSP